MNNEPTHFLTYMNNGNAFSSFDGMAYSYQCPDQFQFLPGHWQTKKYCISRDFQKPNLLEKNSNNTKNNMNNISLWNY